MREYRESIRPPFFKGVTMGNRMEKWVAVAVFLGFPQLAGAADKATPIPSVIAQPAKGGVPSQAKKNPSSPEQLSLSALQREEQEMRRQEEELLKKVAPKAQPQQGSVRAVPSPGKTPQSGPAPVKKVQLTQPITPPPVNPQSIKPQPRPTTTSIPSASPQKSVSPRVSPTAGTSIQVPVSPTKVPPPQVVLTSKPTAASSPIVPKSPTPTRTPVPARKTNTPLPTPKPNDAELLLLREQVSILTSRNREVELELEELRRQLVTAETEVERLNEFLGEQGNNYLNSGYGEGSRSQTQPRGMPSSNSSYSPSRYVPRRMEQRRNEQMEYPTSERSSPSAYPASSAVVPMPARRAPAGSLQADRDVPIASVVAGPALGREEPNGGSPVIERLPRGARVTVERETGGWYRVLTPQGIRVWVAGQDLAFGEDGSITPIRQAPKSQSKDSVTLPPELLKPGVPEVGQGQGAPSDGRSDEERALELLRQSMGEKK